MELKKKWKFINFKAREVWEWERTTLIKVLNNSLIAASSFNDFSFIRTRWIGLGIGCSWDCYKALQNASKSKRNFSQFYCINFRLDQRHASSSKIGLKIKAKKFRLNSLKVSD
jgi:hypothetical protein